MTIWAAWPLLPGGTGASWSKRGIRCLAFNPFVPLVSLVMNNRDPPENPLS